ncbi:MAG TPA: hypothetical protein VIL28_08140 [Steroidobacteraceae bacterium]
MKPALIVLFAAVALAGCATSQAPTPASAGSGPAASKTARTAEQIMMDELLDNEKAHAVLKKHAPHIADHPQVGMARGMSLGQVAGYAEAGLSAETVQAIVDDINKL